MIIENIKKCASDSINLLDTISGKDFNHKSIFAANSTIGAHIRHVIECLNGFLHAAEDGSFSYDKRERNIMIETNKDIAVSELQNILQKLNSIQALNGASYKLRSDILCSTDHISTSFERELLYNFDHFIHHQALIKVILYELKLSHLVSYDFGFAPSTIKYLSSK